VSKIPQKISSGGLLGKFVVIAATVVVKNKTGRKISLSGICFIKVNKINAICIFVRPEFFCRDWWRTSAPFQNIILKIWHWDC